MGLVTGIAAGVAVGGQLAKGFIARDASKEAARMAGRLNIQKEQLEQEAVSRLETNYYDALRATTDVYDKQLQTANAITGQIVEKAAEGDQRGLVATAGKVKQGADATTGLIADKYAGQQLDIEGKRAQAAETDAARIAMMFDDRAQAAGVKADALTQQSDDLKGKATGSFINAGTSALAVGLQAFGGLAGMKNAQGKAVKSLLDSGAAKNDAEALKIIDGYSKDQLKQTISSGLPFVLKSTAPNTPLVEQDEDVRIDDKNQQIGYSDSVGMDQIGYSDSVGMDQKVKAESGFTNFFSELKTQFENFTNPFGDFSEMFQGLGLFKTPTPKQKE
jgi:hypothetical protein